MLSEDVLDLQRRDPLASGFDDIFDAVRHLQVSRFINKTNIRRVQVPSSSEIL
jgi:hypothetical protein